MFYILSHSHDYCCLYCLFVGLSRNNSKLPLSMRESNTEDSSLPSLVRHGLCLHSVFLAETISVYSPPEPALIWEPEVIFATELSPREWILPPCRPYELEHTPASTMAAPLSPSTGGDHPYPPIKFSWMHVLRPLCQKIRISRKWKVALLEEKVWPAGIALSSINDF